MLLTRKFSERGATPTSSLVASLARGVQRAIPTMDRRAFLRRSGLGVGVGLATSQLTLVRKAQAADAPAAAAKPVTRRTVCTHCSVGCAVDAVVENGVWTRQEPVFDSPLNLGAHCAKGAA
ncbi:MAG TPA: twin-arginine translocation signal domain-containing protein, partial [Caldimonas sp.]